MDGSLILTCSAISSASPLLFSTYLATAVAMSSSKSSTDGGRGSGGAGGGGGGTFLMVDAALAVLGTAATAPDGG